MNWEQQREQREWAERVTDVMLEQARMVQELVGEALEDLDSLYASRTTMQDIVTRSRMVYDLLLEWGREYERGIDRMYADVAEYYA